VVRRPQVDVSTVESAGIPIPALQWGKPALQWGKPRLVRPHFQMHPVTEGVFQFGGVEGAGIGIPALQRGKQRRNPHSDAGSPQF